MKREIKFRGQLCHSKEWVVGNLIIAKNGEHYIYPSEVIEPDGHHLLFSSDSAYWVDEGTVGQYVNLPNNIYNHDIIGSKLYPNAVHVIVWNQFNCCFSAISKESYNLMQKIPTFNKTELINARGVKPEWILEYDFQVIGNIHDNPEYIK